MNTSLSGGCCCSSVRYQLNGEHRDLIACHCVECRKSSGHFTVSTSVAPADLQILTDEDLRWYRASGQAERGFCQRCGSSLFWKPDSDDRISVFAGTLDQTADLAITAHIFVAEKGSYYSIDDGTPRFDTTGARLTLK